MWLTLENGTARLLARRLNVDFVDPSPSASGRTALILQAAWTLLDEAAVESLPYLAAKEIRSGLSGPVRRRLSVLDRDSPQVLILRDQLIERIVGQAGQAGALQLADRVHLSRLTCARAPAIVAAACLSWYGNQRSIDDLDAEFVDTMSRLVEQWKVDERSRQSVELHMRRLAVSVISDHTTDLVDTDV